MAIILLAINEIGLGHLSRMVEIADHLYEKGEKPILFYQCKKFPFPSRDYLTRRIQPLLRSDETYIKEIEEIINTSCSITSPSIFIEDTHPSSLKIRDTIDKFLVVRPTTFTYLSFLKRAYGSYYQGFFIADHYDSPTWPYTEEETDTISKWSNWHLLHPIYRKPAISSITAIKNNYSILGKQPIVVFSMGGGGQQAGADDVRPFLQTALSISDGILSNWKNVRLIFIKGPLFPKDVEIPDRFEVVDNEPEMPALLQSATAAVIRPSYNTIWECIHGGVPFYAVEGTTFSEPIDSKLQRLRAFGLLLQEQAFDEKFHPGFKLACKKIISRWNGYPADRFFELLTGLGKSSLQIPDDLQHLNRGFIRIDDVYQLDEELIEILSLCQSHQLFTSLEIIPYLTKLEEQELRPFDPDYKNIIVSQHGYSHLLNAATLSTKRSEYSFSSEVPGPEEQELLAGQVIMRNKYPKRYKKGFSAPFDAYPEWLEGVWEKNDYAYITAIHPPAYLGFPCISASVDVWDWTAKQMKPAHVLSDLILRSIRKNGYYGIVLHPIHFRIKANRERLRALLDDLDRSKIQQYNPSLVQEIPTNPKNITL